MQRLEAEEDSETSSFEKEETDNTSETERDENRG